MPNARSISSEGILREPTAAEELAMAVDAPGDEAIRSKMLNRFGSSSEGELLGLAPKRVLQSHITLGNEKRTAVKSGEIVQFEEPIFGFALRFQLAAAANMHWRNAAIEQRGTNHQEAVTLQRIFLGAHERDVGCGVQLQRTLDPGAKILGFAALVV